ncbi:MAG: DUF1822 family protein [Microcoleaceae cyanobacterium]
MNNTTLNLSEMMLDFESFHPDIVELNPEQINQALNLSQTIDSSQQWRVYLNALGCFGLENWLAENSSDLILNTENCSLDKPELNFYSDAIFQLQVNQFKVCLLTVGSLTDEVVTVPRMVLDLPEYTAHFYIVVEVQEELETACVCGFFSYQDWQQYQAAAALQPELDWTYSIPLAWMNLNPEQLLLQWRCLTPANIPLLPIPNRTTELTAIAAELQKIIPNLPSENQTIIPLWQQLSWQQASVVLTQSELLQWVYQIQTIETPNPSIISQLRQHLSDIVKLLTQPSINVSRWLSNQLDDIATELSWILLPNLSLSPATAMRSGADNLTNLLQELQQLGVEIPPEIGGAYQDLQLNNTPLRLYTVTWSLDSVETNPEWILLLILGTPSGVNLPSGVGLRVSDATEILDEQQLSRESSIPYLYTQVIGSWHEKFIVTLTTASGTEETLPPLTFNPDSN